MNNAVVNILVHISCFICIFILVECRSKSRVASHRAYVSLALIGSYSQTVVQNDCTNSYSYQQTESSHCSATSLPLGTVI